MAVRTLLEKVGLKGEVRVGGEHSSLRGERLETKDFLGPFHDSYEDRRESITLLTEHRQLVCRGNPAVHQ